DTQIGCEIADHAEHSHPRRIAFRLRRQVRTHTCDRGDAHAAVCGAPCRNTVADRLEAVAEHVKADCHIADARRRKSRCNFTHDQSFAPKYAHTRNRSANTPPAVTSGPAPGPCTIKGFWLYRQVMKRTTLSVKA